MPQRISFTKQKIAVKYPDLLGLQLESFSQFFQIDTLSKDRKKEGLYKIFQNNFPISDTKNNFTLEFINYSIADPRYTPQECIEKDITYTVPLKVQFKLHCKDEEEPKVIEQDLFLGNIPYMTPQSSFIINGRERVVVPQIRRSYGVFFTQNNPISGKKLYTAKIIPCKGTWIEFIADTYTDNMYVYIDRRKKFPVTLILRALGYSTDKDILEIFNLGEEVKVTKKELEKKKGRKLAARVLETWVEELMDANSEIGEFDFINRSKILLEQDDTLDKESITTILNSTAKTIVLHKKEGKHPGYTLLYNTFKKDNTNSEKEAIEEIYRQLRGAEPPDEQTAKEFITHLFFSRQRSYLGEVGRYCINKKLGLNISKDNQILTKEDVLQTIKHFFNFINGKTRSDDIDHLSNRRVRVVNEQLSDIFNKGIERLARVARERMNVRGGEEFNPSDLVSSRILSSIANTYFGTNPQSQFMDQVNILSEISHKRRLSSLGVGGLSRERTGFEARDVHYTQFNRICPIETPEGANIGLITSLSMYARVDKMGFIQTPYIPVKNGKIGSIKQISYFTADEEEGEFIAQATSNIDEKRTLLDKNVKVRQNGNFLQVEAKKVTLIDVSKDQMGSLGVASIPFVNHDDATRALMGANMQRQALPLQQTEAPIVGTGLEARIVQDSRNIPKAEENGIVIYVDARKIVVKRAIPEDTAHFSLHSPTKTYHLKQLVKTNQGICKRLKPIVRKGEKIKKGQILCEGYGTKDAELALGRNLNVAFMSWKGYNYEDGIVISDRLVKQGIFTSIHMEEFTSKLSKTKLGTEEFTAEIPNVIEDAIQNLDENGIIRVGKKVKEGDILIGKVVPRGETDLSPENALLQAIFGKKAYNVKNASLKAPPSFEGTVVETKIFSRKKRTKLCRERAAKEVTLLEKATQEKLTKLQQRAVKKLTELLQEATIIGIYNTQGKQLISPQKTITKELLLKKIFSTKKEDLSLRKPLHIKNINLEKWTDNVYKNKHIKALLQSYIVQKYKILNTHRNEKFEIEIGDDLPLGILKKAKVRIVKKRKIKVGDKLASRHGGKGIIVKIAREEDMPYLANGKSIDIVLSPLGIPSRMNIGQLHEAMLGLAGQKLGKKYAVPIFDTPTIEEIAKELEKAKQPKFGRTTLYDGCTGEPFDQKVTCGVIYMLKLNHLIDEKMHARSTGSYALITQQPLGGRSNFGGQRFGEMEVWALKAYGVAYNLQRMLSQKSDDIIGRRRLYEALVNGKNPPKPNMTEGFKVFRRELRGLCIELTFK